MATSERIRRAFINIPRENFLPSGQKHYADLDVALRIGFGQTNSQPTTVRMMLSWLEPRAGDKILDVGSGSGWTTALLGNIVGPNGKVYGVEKIPQLRKMGKINCQKMNIANVYFHLAGKEYGLPEESPYDRILVSASAPVLPKELLSQLKIGGRMVIPINYDILVIDKISDGKFNKTVHPGFIFVPLF